MSIEGPGHFFTIYFPGVVCFVLYFAKISGEHWSSGWICIYPFLMVLFPPKFMINARTLIFPFLDCDVPRRPSYGVLYFSTYKIC